MNRITRLLIVLLLLLHTAAGQEDNTRRTKQRIENYLIALEGVGFHGSVLVVLRGEVLLSNGYGFLDRQAASRNTAETIYDIGSITKQFTAAAILKLEMQGKLSVEDPLSKYFPDLPADKKNITLHDLLRHQSGLISTIGGDYEKISEEEFVRQVFASTLFTPSLPAPITRVWRAYTTPEDIMQWNAASDDWQTTAATVDLRVGGDFCSRMEAKDGSVGFDFAGTYTNIVPQGLIEYAFGDRTARVEFAETPGGVRVRVTFESETTHTIEQQRDGWQAILDNFARHVEANL
jgi:uncharacterized protein YndB with AHSA1/START domain